MPPDHGAMGGRQQSADLKDDPLVARGEAAMMRQRDRSNIKDRQDAAGGGQAVPKMQASEQAKQPEPKIVPLSAVKRRALASKKVTIDLMVLYTSKVAAKYVEVRPDLIALSIEQGNESFANSDLGNVKLRLVHDELIDYDETDGEHFNHLYRMVDGEGAAQREARRHRGAHRR
jgi:hypothetical protein